ncbi:HupE/UreJ family protein [Vibrio breoganii]
MKTSAAVTQQNPLKTRKGSGRYLRSGAIATVLSLATPAVAFAHPGHDHHSFSAGLTHPITGFDHLIMLLAFGLLIGCLSLNKAKTAGLLGAGMVSLLVGLFAGQALGYAAFFEPMIIASLFVVSVCLWQVFNPSAKKVTAALSVSAGLLFFHGYAHGVEAASNLSQFALGMTATAAALVLCGSVMGRWISSKWLSIGIASASALLMIAA